MVRYGPSPVTATAVALVKNVACKILDIPPSRVLNRPHSIATPNRVAFQLTHPNLMSNMSGRSLVDVRREIDKEVNRMIRADIGVEVYHNLTLSELLNRFGSDVIDRYYDINESEFSKWLDAEYERIMNQPIWNNWLEKQGPFLSRKRYQTIEGIRIDQKESIKTFLKEINGKEIDLLCEKKRKYFMKRRHWMRETGQIDKDVGENESEFELVTGTKWTHMMGIFDKISNTNYTSADKDLKFAAYNIEGVGCGLCLPNHYSSHWDSQNIQTPIDYLKSTAELGRIVIYQMRLKKDKTHTIRFNVDVFPGYNSEIIGSNPYFLFRETFNIRHLASIIPDHHDLTVPLLAVPDLNQK